MRYIVRDVSVEFLPRFCYTPIMSLPHFRIFIGEIPYSEGDAFWVSFESDPRLKKTRENIYGRCLPCIQNLYHQLQEGRSEITLGTAFHCWKVAAVVGGIDACLQILAEFESCASGGHVYGKFGSGRPGSDTKAVVFHTDTEEERDRIEGLLRQCLPRVEKEGDIVISRACGVLYDAILGDWRHWRPVTPIRHPEAVPALLQRIKKTLFWSVM